MHQVWCMRAEVVYAHMRMYVGAHTRPHATCHTQSPRGMPRADFSCKFAYKIDVNFYKTIIATIYVTIMLTKLRPPGRVRNSC